MIPNFRHWNPFGKPDSPRKWEDGQHAFITHDIFELPTHEIDELFAVFAANHQHTFHVLTMHPKKMQNYTSDTICDRSMSVEMALRAFDRCYHSKEGRPEFVWPLKNVWLGVYVRDQEEANKNILPLIESVGHTKLLLCETLFGEVSLQDVLLPEDKWEEIPGYEPEEAGRWLDVTGNDKNGDPFIDLVICGGNRSQDYDEINPVDYVRSLRDQCVAADIPFFFKGWNGDKTDRLLDGVEWNQLPKPKGENK